MWFKSAYGVTFMNNPLVFSKSTMQALALTLLLVFASGCQEQAASVANTNANA